MTEEQRLARNQAAKDKYYWYKSHGICVRCGQRDAFYNHVHCPECIEQLAQYESDTRNKINARKRAMRAKYKELGLCQYCGKPVCEESKTVCAKHFKQRRAYHRIKTREYVAKHRTKTLDQIAEERRLRNQQLIKIAQASEGLKKARVVMREREHKVVVGILAKKEAEKKWNM